MSRFIHRLGIAIVLAYSVWASAAVADTPPAISADILTKARDDCRIAAASRVGDTPTPREGVQAMLGMAGRAACADVSIAQISDPLPALDAVSADLDRAEAAYGCLSNSATPACAGVAAAKTRQRDLRLLHTGEVEQLHFAKGSFTRFDATAWRPRNGSFGASNQLGVSLIRLVLDASAPGSALARRAQPDVPYAEIAADLASATTPCASCGEQVARVISLYSTFDVLDRIYMAETKDAFDATLERNGRLNQRWQAYHFGGGKGRAQLPWELALNSIIYADKRSADGLWPEPPNSAFILLHPSPGLAMKDVKGASVVVNAVEVFGKSWWSYDDKTQSRKNEWGVSALAAYRSRDDAKNWGYGVLVRTPLELSSLPINIAWTRTKLDKGGHDDTVSLSVDISRYVPTWKSAACRFKLPSCERWR